MDIVHERAAGLDISKRDAKVCVRVPGPRAGTYTSTVTTWAANTHQILELREFLEREHVSTVVMEATSDYWKPFYYLMEETLPVMLVNAKAARNVPGRKTDVSDAAWLAQLAAFGLLRASFVPPEPIRELRDLTRARAIATRDRAREIQRLEKFLESSGIKLSSVVSDLTGVSSRNILEALINGERNPEVLAGMARGMLRSKIPALIDALTGRFKPHHAFMVRLHLDQIDTHTRVIEALTARIEEAMEPFRDAREALAAIPGVSRRVAEVIIAETGADMAVFETPARLASWAGVCPGANESAGRIKSAHILPGNKYLKGALGIAAMAAARSKNTYLAARYHRITARSGRNKALVAVEHSILTAAWHMLANGECYNEPGADHFTRINPTRAKNNAIKQLNSLGYDVTITPVTAA
ncbi:IS110 family transposase [Arthrobacter sp. SRS-W-1-2016]|uniref:IS110 family transposase n=1 Tax=Arthrobacter sp. SRS-W-1-2016 TaxID=1930254 RepID=UPI000990C0D9|nr:IS110 family transposase [Arthrobacter sp. SRS-W-1-2016]OOP59150.1 IS110 family transposase [Arthrobacter sp. SRS-W-1-2016]